MQTQFSFSQAKICNVDAVIALRRLEKHAGSTATFGTRLAVYGFSPARSPPGQAPRSHLRSEFPMGFLSCKPPFYE